MQKGLAAQRGFFVARGLGILNSGGSVLIGILNALPLRFGDPFCERERKSVAVVNWAIEARNAPGARISMKYGMTFAVGAAIAVLAASVLLASLDDGSDYSPYGPHAGAPALHKSASSR